MTEELQPQEPHTDDLRAQRLAKLDALREAGNDPFALERYDRTHTAAQLVAKDAPHWSLTDEEREALTVSAAGRLTAHRSKGKAGFADIRDESGRVQLYVRKDDVGEEAYELYKTLDLSDFVGVKGFPFVTHTGEPSIHVKELTLLAKSLRSVPFGKQDEAGNIYNALSDVEDRYRYRYLDLLSNPQARDVLTKRSKIVSAMRRFLDGQGFLEVETPTLQLVAGGAAARPFLTHHNALDHDFKLRISLELYLKRLIIGGYEKVYEIGRVYRNEGVSTRHNPEFTLMELYQAYTDLDGMMELVEAMYEFICRDVNGVPTFTDVNTGETIDLSVHPWRRLPMLEGIREYAGIAPEELASLETGKAACERIGVKFSLEREENTRRAYRKTTRGLHTAETDSADLYYRLPHRNFAPRKKTAGQPRSHSTFRGLCCGAGTRQRLLGDQRPD